MIETTSEKTYLFGKGFTTFFAHEIPVFVSFRLDVDMFTVFAMVNVGLTVAIRAILNSEPSF